LEAGSDAGLFSVSGGMTMAVAKDPICGMAVDTANPPGGTAAHAGTTYYFCSNGCRTTFEQDPAKYAELS
jgi:Cu+-exporting ATPase